MTTATSTLIPRVLALIAILPVIACFPPPIGDGETGDSETFDVGDTTDLTGDGDGEPGDGDGDTHPCYTDNLPHDWGEGLADVWIHSCSTDGTFVECCAAAWTQAEHLTSVFAVAGGASHWWHTPPLFAGADDLEGPYHSDGKIRFSEVHWNHCGLPTNGDNPTSRTFELRVTDHDLGVTASQSVTMGGGVIGCPDDWPCDAQPMLKCDSGGCWASSPSWTGEAKSISDEGIDALTNSDSWNEVQIVGVDGVCWETINGDLRVCATESCGMFFYGQPASDVPLDPPQPACGMVGPWESTWSAFDACFGIVKGIAVELRGQGCAVQPFGLGCPCAGMDCQDGLVCDGIGCTSCPDGSPGCQCGEGGYCEVGECITDQTGQWSACTPDPCNAGSCAGDYTCVDGLCLWPA